MRSLMGAKAISLSQSNKIAEDYSARTFVVKGSGGDTYTVTVGTFVSSCDCPAGKLDRPCYHKAGVRLRIAAQNRKALAETYRQIKAAETPLGFDELAAEAEESFDEDRAVPR